MTKRRRSVIQKKIAKNKFDFNDFLGQIQQIKKMGNVKDLMGMIPGMGKGIEGMWILMMMHSKGIEAIIRSMTTSRAGESTRDKRNTTAADRNR